ncbi:MAG: hypothetical protein WB630_11180, partial [Candidatus Acidiferrales bacterium]
IGPDLGKDVVNPSRDVYKTKADVVNLIQQAVADGANLIQQQGDAGLEETTKFPFGNKLVPPIPTTGCSSSRTAASTTASSWCMSRQQHGAAGIVAAIRPLKVLDIAVPSASNDNPRSTRFPPAAGREVEGRRWELLVFCCLACKLLRFPLLRSSPLVPRSHRLPKR